MYLSAISFHHVGAEFGDAVSSLPHCSPRLTQDLYTHTDTETETDTHTYTDKYTQTKSHKGERPFLPLAMMFRVDYTLMIYSSSFLFHGTVETMAFVFAR